MLTCINNVRFDSPEGWQVAYADVRAVRNFTICELLFTGRLTDCQNFIYDRHYDQTATPTGSSMKFRSKTSLGLPERTYSNSVNDEYQWGTPIVISGNAPTNGATTLPPITKLGSITRRRKIKKKIV